MRAVRTARSNFVWVGPTPDIGDLHAFVERDDNRTTTVWEPTPEERTAIANGGNVALVVLGQHPPVAIHVTSEQGVGEDSAEIHARLREWQAKELDEQ